MKLIQLGFLRRLTTLWGALSACKKFLERGMRPPVPPLGVGAHGDNRFPQTLILYRSHSYMALH